MPPLKKNDTIKKKKKSASVPSTTPKTTMKKSPIVMGKILQKEIGKYKGLYQIKSAKNRRGMVHFKAQFGVLPKIKKLMRSSGMILDFKDISMKDQIAYTLLYQVMLPIEKSIPMFTKRQRFGVQALKAVQNATITHPCFYEDILGSSLVPHIYESGTYTSWTQPIYMILIENIQDYRPLNMVAMKNVNVLLSVERALYCLTLIGYDTSTLQIQDLIYSPTTNQVKFIRLDSLRNMLPQWKIKLAIDALGENSRKEFQRAWPNPKWLRNISTNILTTKRLESYPWSEMKCPSSSTSKQIS
jgi:hypothetical protein